MNSSISDVDNEQEGLPIYIAMIEAGLLLLVSSIGIACNLLAFVVMVRHSAFKNSFGYLAAVYAFSNTAVLSCFVLWAVPWTIWPIPDELQFLNQRIGPVSLSFFEATLHCTFFISVNRFVAITFPTHYRRIFTTTVTYSIIFCIVVIDILYLCVYFMSGCDYFYQHSPSGWTFGSEPCAQIVAFYIDYYYNYSIFIAFLLLDIITVLQLRSRRKKLVPHTSGTGASRNMMEAKKERKEFMFFIQAALSSVTYLILFVSATSLASVVMSEFQMFLSGTLLWAFVHTMGG
uniref:G_PROTEIN_RECEP_F1_2 domain-containing protein n=1 Tax=Haemonchus contortus TaxID=6289 RepID=A0A7I4Y2V1_HAECO